MTPLGFARFDDRSTRYPAMELSRDRCEPTGVPRPVTRAPYHTRAVCHAKRAAVAPTRPTGRFHRRREGGTAPVVGIQRYGIGDEIHASRWQTDALGPFRPATTADPIPSKYLEK